MLTDYHSHVLPSMDDGAYTVRESLRMLDMWAAQDVARVAATPHFHLHREPAKTFLARRDDSISRLPAAGTHPALLIGAEVYISEGLCEISELTQLTLAGSKYIMLELPYFRFSQRVLEEAQNIMHDYGLIPIFAHIERYIQWYTNADIMDVLAIPGVVWQVNHESLFYDDTLDFTLDLIQGGHPVIFGSDAHNTRQRPPNAAEAYPLLRKLLTRAQYDRLLALNANLLDV